MYALYHKDKKHNKIVKAKFSKTKTQQLKTKYNCLLNINEHTNLFARQLKNRLDYNK